MTQPRIIWKGHICVFVAGKVNKKITFVDKWINFPDARMFLLPGPSLPSQTTNNEFFF